MMSSADAYDNLNNGMDAKELHDTHCAGLVNVPLCLKNCYKRLKMDASMDNDEFPELPPSAPGTDLVSKNSFKIKENFSNREPVFDCAKKIYPLIAKPEENTKCRKISCSKPNDKAGLYACNERDGYQEWIQPSIYAGSREDMCQFACVIDQAAKHAYDKCSMVLTEMLLVARQDVQKIYQDLDRERHRNENQEIVISDIDSTTTNEPTTSQNFIETSTTSLPIKVNPMK
uniref:Apple domain-containing protein n=1 Tax=Panagrellus redivivus TaxID=6233 RepID=A0A7E4V3W1_PANRE